MPVAIDWTLVSALLAKAKRHGQQKDMCVFRSTIRSSSSGERYS